MGAIAGLRSDLADEHASLDQIVADLPERDWRLATPSPGWTIADQIGHLAAVDWKARLAMTDAEAFVVDAAEIMQQVAAHGDDSFMLAAPRAMAPPELLEWWRDGRAALLSAAAELSDDTRLPWYGPSMGLRSFLTARLMETWAHGQDVVDALGVERAVTDRLRHVAHLGVITRGFSYAVRGREAPDGEVSVALVAPSGDRWTWGAADAADRVEGPALDFCLVVTQRRHVDDTQLDLTGDAAREWMSFAQAFAGPPTVGPEPAGR